MNSIITYAEKNLEPLSSGNFNRVDSLILSCLCYLRTPEAASWQGVKLRELARAENFKEMFSGVVGPENLKTLLYTLAASPRFRDIIVCGATENSDPEVEKQFAATTYRTSDLAYVAYRGTDSTFVGWKEDFNLAFQYPIPSQLAAANYLAEAAAKISENYKFRLGGHSKGGNLAVYAAANCPGLRDRIEKIYSHDGPGFIESVLESEMFRKIEPKLDKTVPQSSLIGMILEHQENFTVVKSTKQSVWQHDPFTWLVDGNDLVTLNSLEPKAKCFDATLNEWLSGLDKAERERFVDALFGLIDLERIATFDEFGANWQQNLRETMRAAAGMDPETKEFVKKTLKALLTLCVKNYPELLRARRDLRKERRDEGR